MNTVFLFAGQGSQVVGMGTGLARQCGKCRELLERADQAVGFALTRIMAEGPEEELRKTEVVQPALVALEVAEARHLVSLGLQPDVLVGHSLGQYAALVVARSMEFETAVKLVAERGRLMQEAVPAGVGAMAAVLGLDCDTVSAICQRVVAGVVEVACHNGPAQTVISGAVAAVEEAAKECEEQGAAIVPLAVSAPFHCQLLTSMVSSFADLVEAAPIAAPRLPVIDNVTGRALADAADVKRSLVEQVVSPVLFYESMRAVRDEGVRRFVQCGPGRNLLTFARKTCPEGIFQNYDDVTAASHA